jgi:hypothetical protein
MEIIKAKFSEFYAAVKYIEILKSNMFYEGTWITIKGNKFKLKMLSKRIDKTGREWLDYTESHLWYYLNSANLTKKMSHKFLADHDNFLAILQFLDEENNKIEDKNTEIEIEFDKRARAFRVNGSTLTIILPENFPSYPGSFIFPRKRELVY